MWQRGEGYPGHTPYIVVRKHREQAKYIVGERDTFPLTCCFFCSASTTLTLSSNDEHFTNHDFNTSSTRAFFTDISRVLIPSRIVRKFRVSEFRVARSGGHNIFLLYRCERYDRQHLNGSPRQNADSCVETCPKL